LSFIKFCYPNDIFFITYLIKITYTSQLQHLKLATTFHQINTPCATCSLSRNPQKTGLYQKNTKSMPRSMTEKTEGVEKG
jgi:hypothetical protein